MKKCCFNENLDMISDLPDPIRSHIVYFLPMRDAIRTRVLSKQWLHVCSSLSRMKFHESDFKNKADFKDFVYEVLIHHDGSDIESFSLKTSINNISISSRHVNTWISFGLQHNVQDLEMHLSSLDIEKLPTRFFTCSTLRVLSLDSVKIEWPSIIRFPVLKYLCVDDVEFNNDNTIGKLVSSSTCPMLEDLVIRPCDLGVDSLSICNPSLKYVQIFGETLSLDISVSTLRILDCIWFELPNISSETLLSLRNAHFELRGNTATSASQFMCARRILLGLRNVKTLVLNGTFIEFLSRGRDVLLASLPSSYCSLKHLNLGLRATSIHVQVIKLLLRSCPHVHTLEISRDEEWESISMDITDMEDHLQFKEWESISMKDRGQFKELPPGDMLNCLKIVKIDEFKGSKNEVDLVRYLLETAQFLQEMSIEYCVVRVVRNPIKEREMLSTFARVAPNVTISLS